jgi:hypothetical protein
MNMTPSPERSRSGGDIEAAFADMIGSADAPGGATERILSLAERIKMAEHDRLLRKQQ